MFYDSKTSMSPEIVQSILCAAYALWKKRKFIKYNICLEKLDKLSKVIQIFKNSIFYILEWLKKNVMISLNSISNNQNTATKAWLISVATK